MYGTRIPLVTGRAALDGGRPRVSATAASGAEGLLSRLIGMRLLGMHCRVTRWGLFSRREGFPLMPCRRTSCPSFYHSGLRWKLFLGNWSAAHGVEVHDSHDEDKIESSTEAGYKSSTVDHQTNVSENTEPPRFCRLIVCSCSLF
jgi:hypothetical protein